jgi:hypothetical protein
MNNRALGCSLASACVCAFFQFEKSAAADETIRPDLNALRAEIRQLVLKHYPKADVTLDKQSIRIRFNVRTFKIHAPRPDGTWQEAIEEKGPQRDGLYGDLELLPGKYKGEVDVPQALDKHYFLHLVMAPYSAKLDRHLRVDLKYPRDVSHEFVTDFKGLVNAFEKRVAAPGK